MNIQIIYQNKNLNIIKKAFEPLTRSRKYNITLMEFNDYKKVKLSNTSTLYYLDITGFEVKKIQRHIKKFVSASLHYGIIDLKNTYPDIAWFFHNKACDYLGKDILNLHIREARIKSIIESKSIQMENETEKYYIPSGNSWESITQGQEYTFCFMFIEIVDIDELKTHVGTDHLDKKIFSFRHYLENSLARVNGKLWMWMDATGLFLFPFDGRTIPSITHVIRLILNRTILSIEHTLFGKVIRYRIAMHIGNTVYKPRGQTGTIISDSINSLFHLGQKFTTADGLFITEDVYTLLDARTKSLFVKTQQFEGRQIYRLKRLL